MTLRRVSARYFLDDEVPTDPDPINFGGIEWESGIHRIMGDKGFVGYEVSVGGLYLVSCAVWAMNQELTANEFRIWLEVGTEDMGTAKRRSGPIYMPTNGSEVQATIVTTIALAARQAVVVNWGAAGAVSILGYNPENAWLEIHRLDDAPKMFGGIRVGGGGGV